MMTIRIEGRRGLIRALELLRDDIEAGLVVSCSLHYECTEIARVVICYLAGAEQHSELPGLPGVRVIDDDAAEADTKPL